jgi:hypothetical protein
MLVLLPAAVTTAQQRTLTCVGLYSETGAGYVSQRVGTAAWTPIKVGDVIAANAQVRVNVDRDWVEFIVTGAPTAVYELTGSTTGEVPRPKQNSDIHYGVNRMRRSELDSGSPVSALALPRC